MLKVLLVSTFFPPYNFGGDGIYLHRLSNALALRGHQVDVLHNADAYRLLKQSQELTAAPNHPNVTVHAVKKKLGYGRLLLIQQTGRSLFLYPLIAQLISEKKFDVIHYNNMSLMGLTAMIPGAAVKLYTMHEHWLVCPMHILWKYNREVCTRQQCVTCQLAGLRPVQWWRYSRFMEKTLRYVDMFLAPSEFTLNKHRELGLDLPMRKLPLFLPQRLEPPPGRFPHPRHQRPYFLFVGRLEKIKGLQAVIPLFRESREYDLVVAGTGGYEAELRHLAKYAPNVVFLGWQSYEQLQPYYAHAVAVIVCSIGYEVFGNTIIEAFAHRTPVLVNDLGALPEIVRQSDGGLIYRNSAELLAKMNALIATPEARRQHGENGYRAYRRYWTDEVHIQQYVDLIEEIRERKNKVTATPPY